MTRVYTRRHAREGGHPVSQSVGDSISGALEYSLPAHSRSKNGVASLAYGGDDV
jgi:hypothetical protein